MSTKKEELVAIAREGGYEGAMPGTTAEAIKVAAGYVGGGGGGGDEGLVVNITSGYGGVLSADKTFSELCEYISQNDTNVVARFKLNESSEPEIYHLAKGVGSHTSELVFVNNSGYLDDYTQEVVTNTIFINSSNTVTRKNTSVIDSPVFRVTFTKSGNTYTSNYSLSKIYEKAKHNTGTTMGRFIYGCVQLGSAVDTTRWILTSCDNGAKAIFMKVGLDTSSNPAKLKVDALVSNANVSASSNENKFYLVEDVRFPDAT